jgi:hypothetical protein
VLLRSVIYSRVTSTIRSHDDSRISTKRGVLVTIIANVLYVGSRLPRIAINTEPFL